MAFKIYDYDGDLSICNLDLYTFLKNYEHDNDVFLKAYAGDISKIENAIEKKKAKLGLINADVKYRLREIDIKLRELGGKLEVPLLENFNYNAIVKNEIEDESESDSNYSNID